MTSFPTDLRFPNSRLFCVAFAFFVLFERLGDEYFSWWYVQHMHLYSIVNLRLFLSILFYMSNMVLKRQTDTVNGTSIS